jgi:hypothetical protein
MPNKIKIPTIEGTIYSFEISPKGQYFITGTTSTSKIFWWNLEQISNILRNL